MIAKPGRVFDRDAEWRHLVAFAERAASRPQIAVVSGRRRQGKTYLLDALVAEVGGFYFGATQATVSESLALFADALSRYLDTPTPLRFATWDETLRFLFAEPQLQGTTIVIDEFPYLSSVTPALPSIIQREFDAAERRDSGPSLILCGSATSVMGRLLSGSSPLRGRANLELVVRPFDFLSAREFWGIDQADVAMLVNSVVGGTPAYRRFVNEDSPVDRDDVNDWVLRSVLNPASPLFREARYLLEEEMDVRETELYHSVLGAVAGGNATRGGIANYVGRKATDLGHYLNVLEDSGLLRRDIDLFRSGRSEYRINEPLITFYQVVMRPRWAALESGRAESVWEDAEPRFYSQVVGPRFEQVCREFAALASNELFGGPPGDVGSGVVTDPKMRDQIQVDQVVLAPAVSGEPRRILAIGEAKWGKELGMRHVSRLLRARDLLARKGFDTRETAIALFSGAGFAADLTPELSRARVITTGLDALYSGSVA